MKFVGLCKNTIWFHLIFNGSLFLFLISFSSEGPQGSLLEIDRSPEPALKTKRGAQGVDRFSIHIA